MIALVLAASLLGAGGPGPPDVGRLFGCPLDAPSARWQAGGRWVRRALPEVGASVIAPPAWTHDGAPGRVELRSPNGQTSLSVRRGVGGDAATLARTRLAIEAAELGPSHAGPRCGRALAARVAAATGLRDVTVGVYGRPLADRRRSYAVFGRDERGGLIAIVTARWSRRAQGPDLERVRGLLAGLRAGPRQE